MERALKKMARQLNSYDEASLMNLWNEYARRVQLFEPTQEWEENALVFCFLQAACWKNQLFNYHMVANYVPGNKDMAPPFAPFMHPMGQGSKADAGGEIDEDALEAEPKPAAKHKTTILRFPGK